MMQIWGWCGRNRVIETWRRWETQKMWWDGGGHNLVWKWSGPRCSDIRWGGVVVLLRSYGVVCMIMRWYSDDMSEHEELFDGGGWVVYKKSVVGVGWFPFLLTLLVLLYCNASDDIETASNLVFSSFPWYQFGAPVALFLISYCSNQYHLCPTPPITITTMCSRSERRVMQLDAWSHAAWWLSFIRFQVAHSLLLQWVVWHHRLQLY
jgi:hypothetical protein